MCWCAILETVGFSGEKPTVFLSFWALAKKLVGGQQFFGLKVYRFFRHLDVRRDRFGLVETLTINFLSLRDTVFNLPSTFNS